jgi:hypothetical protein
LSRNISSLPRTEQAALITSGARTGLLLNAAQRFAT